MIVFLDFDGGTPPEPCVRETSFGDILTAQQMELVSMSCGVPNNLQSRLMVRVMTLRTR